MRKVIDVALRLCLAVVSAVVLLTAAKLFGFDDFSQGVIVATIFLVAHDHAADVMAGRT
jgi:hypothetical protein